MRMLRVRCVDDGRELLLERHGADEYSIQGAEVKKLILAQRQALYRNCNVTNSSDPFSGLEDCFVLFRGQILADMDVVDLNAWAPSDFFVFAFDAASVGKNSTSYSEMHKDDTNSKTSEMLRSQLVEMGFSTEIAAQALQKSGNNLSVAVSLLVNGEVDAIFGSSGSMHNETATDLVAQYPSTAPLRSLVHDKNIKRLHEMAATDSFQALLLLKEQFSSNLLNRLNEHPVATLQLLSLPLVAMGFARDLVNVLYESCGGDEQRTANALLQTLES
ncbi:unnamed protein product [Peronospora farinosa]|uniref:UBA domain-containing protein n=1 Tax=Peronospora farinosa TaxID=134698 RepID=A0AAV0UAT3_9STRA|nr:unnamed protein product [Peronospora farinosa]CAI5732930.1 unnamed protein product [Peronospora farinosa]